MSFDATLESLLVEGRVRISTADAPTDADLDAAGEILQKFDRRYRLDMPGTPPEISLPAAVWAAQAFYRACQCLTFREISAEETRQMLAPFSGKRDAPAHYSVDLTFRLLPDLIHRAKAASRDDPLVAELGGLARAWPLSSVGVDDVDAGDVKPILDNPCLRRLYLDRIIASGDVPRLNDRRIREAFWAAVGSHDELAPEMAAAVKKLDRQDELE